MSTTNIRTPLTVTQFYFSRPKKKLLAVAAVFGIAWAFTGFMSPSVLADAFVIHKECVDFAKERAIFDAGDVITADNLRMRNGALVVDLIAHVPNSTAIKSRVCRMNGSTIKIVSKLEAPFWN